jgi:hypothetical protein
VPVNGISAISLMRLVNFNITRPLSKSGIASNRAGIFASTVGDVVILYTALSLA